MIVHIIPINDLKEHEMYKYCHCKPKAIYSDGKTIIIHSSYDGREAIEELKNVFGEKIMGDNWEAVIQ